MDEIIWDEQTIEAIIMNLRRASERLEMSRGDLRSAFQEGTEALGGNRGLSQRILLSIEAAFRKTDRLSDRAGELAEAVKRTLELIRNTERGLTGLAAPLHGDIPVPEPRPGHIEYEVRYVNLARGRGIVVPDWLTEAANRAFG